MTGIRVAAPSSRRGHLATSNPSGSGLDESALAHAFDRFWQADPARVGSPSGLGLSIVAGIAAERGGTVGVQNMPDGGARFTIRIPTAG